MRSGARSGKRMVVALSGELDHFTAGGIRRRLDCVLQDEDVRHLVLDLSGLTFMDSSGIGVLLGRYRALTERGGTLSVQNMRPEIERVFTLAGMGRIIPVLRQEQEARV